MEFTLGEMAVIIDALGARLHFGENVRGPYRFAYKHYEEVLKKLCGLGPLRLEIASEKEQREGKSEG